MFYGRWIDDENFCFVTPILEMAITGSSNLTGNGLGITEERQYEFNVKMDRYDDVKFAKEVHHLEHSIFDLFAIMRMLYISANFT